MRNRLLLLSICVLQVVLSCGSKSGITEFTVENLQTNNMLNPEGIENPFFSWQINTEEFGFKQVAYELQIASNERKLLNGKADVFKSGKITSEEQFNLDPSFEKYEDASPYYWRVRVWNDKDEKSNWSHPAYFSTGLYGKNAWKSQWITSTDTERKSIPYFRKVFDVQKIDKEITSAFVFLSGLGASELYLNGTMVDSTRYLDPAQTNYEQVAFYSTYNITNQLINGKNCFGVILGDGWFAQTDGWNKVSMGYGKPMMRFQLVINYNDGSRRIEGSDETWQWNNSPIQKSNVYLGETYDSRKEIKNWCTAK